MKIKWRPILGLVTLAVAMSAASVATSHKYHGPFDPIFFARIVGGALGQFFMSFLIPSGVFAIRKIRDSPNGYPYTAHLICQIIIGALILFGDLYHPD